MAVPVFLDTCVLFGALLNDYLLRLADRGGFDPHWSKGVLDELETNLSARCEASLIRRRIVAMTTAFPFAEVVGYDDLIDRMSCHPKDRHVLAAAVQSGATYLVTFNLRDFPPESFVDFDLDVVHPDSFLVGCFKVQPQLMLTALRDLAEAYTRPPLSVDDILGRLRVLVPDFVETTCRVLEQSGRP